MEASVPAATTVFMSTPVMRQKYLGFLFHGRGPCTAQSALLASEDCKDFVPFVGSKLHKGHMYTALFIATWLLFFLTILFFPAFKKKIDLC